MGEHRALLVANSKYNDDSSLPNLKAPVYDMSRMHAALTNPTSGLFGPEHVRLMPDARSADVLAEMEDFFQSAAPDDTLLLYYSGHGMTDINNNFFLCANDTKVDRLLSTAVRDQTVNEMMRNSPATTFVVILDCCSSGSWKSIAALPTALRGEGRFVLSSSRPGQNSSDATVKTDSSPFTKLLVEAMTTAELDTDSDGYVDIDAVYKHVEKRLKGLKGQQAQRDYGKSTATVALARRPAHVLSGMEATGKAVTGRVGLTDMTLSNTTLNIAAVGATEPPSLTVSPEEISLDVEQRDLPVIERVYVFNRGGGDLAWKAESDHEWITMEVHPEFVRLSIAPDKPGVHRGAIYIRPHGPGRVARVPVAIAVTAGKEPRPSRSIPPMDSRRPESLIDTEGSPVVNARSKTSPTPRTRPRRRTNRERLEAELKRLGFELDPWSPSIWYSDNYSQGHKKPRVAIRPPRIRIETLDEATETWNLARSFSLENELEEAITVIASVRRPRRVRTRQASPVPTERPSTVSPWRLRMSSELEKRGYVRWTVDKTRYVHEQAVLHAYPPAKIFMTNAMLGIERLHDTKYLLQWSFEMERQFDEALAVIDKLPIPPHQPGLSLSRLLESARRRSG